MYKIEPIRVADQKPRNLKYCAPFKINIQKREGLSNFENPVFDLSVYYIQKRVDQARNQKCLHWIFGLSTRD